MFIVMKRVRVQIILMGRYTCLPNGLHCTLYYVIFTGNNILLKNKVNLSESIALRIRVNMVSTEFEIMQKDHI
jgi:hypothetical protein